jgi:hypothetical protein
MSSALRLCGVLVTRSAINQAKNAAVLGSAARQLAVVPVNYQQYEQKRGFKGFGHKPEVVPVLTRAFHAFVGIGFLICLGILCVDWDM